MKRIAGLSALILFLGSLLFGCSFAFSSAKMIRGNGRIVSKQIDMPVFDAISASHCVTVIVSDKVSDKILIEADENLVDLVEAGVSDGWLKVGFADSWKKIKIQNAHVTVTVPACSLRALRVSSAAQIVCRRQLCAEQFSMRASSSGRIEADGKAEECRITASSASEIRAALELGSCDTELSSAAKVYLSGKADSCTACLSSAAKLDAGKLLVGTYDIDASSSASGDIRCTEKLKARVSSAADVRYSGDCLTETVQSSGGSIQKQ